MTLHTLIDDRSATLRLRAWLNAAELESGGRLPPERDLAELLGVSRGALRKALAELEEEGQLWRHVGKGTFIGSRAIDTEADVAAMARRSNPVEVMGARLMLEPEIARLAALNATPSHLSAMRVIARATRDAPTWRQYEAADNALHRLFAESTQNRLILGLLDTLNAVRRQVTWGRLREQPLRPPAHHHSFTEHDEIIDAIAERDTVRAANAMRTHLSSVERKLRGL